MKKYIVIMVLVLAQLVSFAQAPTITAPTRGETFYAGEMVVLRWTPAQRMSYGSVGIELVDNKTGTTKWLAYRADNSGYFEWTKAEMLGSGTNYTIKITEGEQASVPIVILSGTRPPVKPPTVTLKSVELAIRPSVSIEWPVVSGRTYRVQKSTNLVSWETVLEGSADFTGIAGFTAYTDTTAVFYKAFEVTPE